MNVLFLNQYTPPDPAPTSRLIGELADFLRTHGHSCRFVSAGRAYRGPRVSGTARWVRELTSLGRIFFGALAGPRPDVVVALSSPPLLLVPAALAAKWRGARLVHWAMDLYPEIALALGEVRPGPLASATMRLMKWAYLRADPVVALDSDMAGHLRHHGCKPGIIPPWPDLRLSGQAATPAAGQPWTWLYSGNLGRAHEWRTLLDAQAILERDDLTIRLVFQGGGPAVPGAKARAAELGLRHVEWRDYADESALVSSLLAGQVLIATQKPETQGLLWPSKLALATVLPRPILWVGPTRGAIADRLSRSRRNGIFPPGEAAAVAEWLRAAFLDSPGLPPPAPLPDFCAVAAPHLEMWLALLENRPG